MRCRFDSNWKLAVECYITICLSLLNDLARHIVWTSVWIKYFSSLLVCMSCVFFFPFFWSCFGWLFVCVCLVVLISMDISKRFQDSWFLGVLPRFELLQQLFKQQCQRTVVSSRDSNESCWNCGYTFNSSLSTLMHLIIGFFFTAVLQCSS